MTPDTEAFQNLEGQQIELKSAFSWNSRLQRKDDKLRYGIFKSIAGLANSIGGKVVIGSSDEGIVHGIDEEISTLFNENHLDRYESLLHEHIRRSLHPCPISSYSIKFERYGELTVCVISVKPVGGVTYVIDKTDKSKLQHEVHVRTGNRTIHLRDLERDGFLVKRFGGQWPM